MDGWQLVETAPKDGTRVLLWANCWRHPFVGQVLSSGMALLDVPTATATTIEVFATHWTPLPAVPAQV